jgi:Cys-rich protein (TIGR01571 family)
MQQQRQRQQWHSGICGGCLTSTCCFACVIPCFVFAENVNMMEALDIDKIPVVDCFSHGSRGTWAGVLYGLGVLGSAVGTGTTGGAGLASQGLSLLSCLSIFMHAGVRKRIREQYNIGSDCCGSCGDCCCAMFCYSCAMSQERLQLEAETQNLEQGQPLNNRMEPTPY